MRAVTLIGVFGNFLFITISKLALWGLVILITASVFVLLFYLVVWGGLYEALIFFNIFRVISKYLMKKFELQNKYINLIITSIIIQLLLVLVASISIDLAINLSLWLSFRIFISFICSKNKLEFLINLLFISVFWVVLGFAFYQLYVICEGYFLLNKSDTDSAPSSPGEGPSNPQPDPQGGGPDHNAVGVAQSTTNSDNRSDEHSYCTYDPVTDTTNSGFERGGFVDKRHASVFEALVARQQSIKSAANDPNHDVKVTGINPKANVMSNDGITNPSYIIDPGSFRSSIDFINSYYPDQPKDGNIFLKTTPQHSSLDETFKGQHFALKGIAKVRCPGDALMVGGDGTKVIDFTNSRIHLYIRTWHLAQNGWEVK